MHAVAFADRGSPHLNGRNAGSTLAADEARRKLLWKNIRDVVSADDDVTGVLFIQRRCVVGGRGGC